MIFSNCGKNKEEMSNSRRRVKLYVLNGERWVDHGTGYVSTMFMDLDKQTKGIVLLVRSEEDGKVLLESKIKKDTVYQKQGDSETLVVWAEADDHLALSFQEEEGCSEIWEKICQVQRNDYFHEGEEVEDASFEEVQETFEEAQDFSIPIELPPCELSKLDEISELFHSVFASTDGREKLATAIEEESYINQLTDLFHICEDLENTEGLHTLFEIFKLLFLLEKHSLFEMMFHIQNIMDVVGILEYDPSKKQPTRHRQFLTEKVVFKEVIPIHNTDLLNKIHQTYRVQYIKDVLVPVPSFFDENMSALGSFLLFSKIEIVELIQQDGRFVEELFAKLTDDEISDEKRREALCLLRELITFSQSLQNENRITFMKSLSTHGLLQSLEQLLNIDDFDIRSVIVDIICFVVDCNPSMVREYLCKEGNTMDEESLLLNMLIDMLLTSKDNGMGVILTQLIRNLLDPENMGLGTNKMEKSEFLGFFYRHCMHVLTAPIFAATANDGFTDSSSGKDDLHRATILEYIIDILTFCVEHHSYHIKNYVIGKDMLRRVLALLQSNHKFLALAALKFSRRIIGIKDEFYNRYITVGKLLLPVVKAFITNGNRYNLLNSAIIELFEFIRDQNIMSLCNYIVENHMDAFKEHDYVETFKGLQLRYDQEKDRTKIANAEREEQPSPANLNVGNVVRKRRDDRVLDEYEESWFENEEEEINHHSNETDGYSTKPLSAKLKDVDLIDTLPPTTRTDSTPLQNVNRPSSPQNSHKSTKLQKSLSPTSIEKEEENEKPSSPINTSKVSPPDSPANRFPLMKTLPSMNNKPVMNIVINSTMNMLNSNNLIESDLQNDKINGLATTITEKKLNSVITEKISSIMNIDRKMNNALPVTNHETTKQDVHVSLIPTKNKPQLMSLVDYPDDDENDSTDEEEVPSSPAKKQRIGSS